MNEKEKAIYNEAVRTYKKVHYNNSEDIKESIKEHLVELNVIGKDDISELESSVSPPRLNHNYCKS